MPKRSPTSQHPGRFHRCRMVLASMAVMLATGHACADGKLSGERLFRQQCAACHSFVQGDDNRQGPNLFGVVGRPPGQIAGFDYSPAFKKSMTDKTWSDDLLNAWLMEPQNVVPQTMMLYKQDDPQVRLAIIEYLKTLK
jgi:cytochrome c